MIKVTKLSGVEIVINAEIIESLEPGVGNTTVTFVTGNKLLVKDSIDAITSRVLIYHGQVMAEMERVIRNADKPKNGG